MAKMQNFTNNKNHAFLHLLTAEFNTVMAKMQNFTNNKNHAFLHLLIAEFNTVMFIKIEPEYDVFFFFVFFFFFNGL